MRGPDRARGTAVRHPLERLRGAVGRSTLRRMSGHCDVDDAATMMGQDHEYEQQSICDRRHDKEISRRDLMHVIGEECPPGLRRRTTVPRHVLRDRSLADADAE